VTVASYDLFGVRANYTVAEETEWILFFGGRTMAIEEPKFFMGVDEYLKSEESSPVKREYVRGYVHAMAGSTLRHNKLVSNLTSLVNNHLRGTKCQSFFLDVKVRIDSCDSFYYPDFMVSCSAADMSSVFIKTPCFIAEVLSPSTTMIDQREKLVAYQQLETLSEYVLVHQSVRRVDILERATNFTERKVCASGSFVLNSFPNGPLTIDLDAIYENTVWGDVPEDPDTARQIREEVGEYSW